MLDWGCYYSSIREVEPEVQDSQGGSSVGRVLAYKVLVLNPSTISKLGMVAQAYNHSTRVVKAGKSGVQDHPWLHNDSRARLGNRRPTYK